LAEKKRMAIIPATDGEAAEKVLARFLQFRK
jgi:hypothetical protein